MSTAAAFARTMLGRVGAALLDLLLPPRCLGCGGEAAEQGGLCAACWRRLVFLGPPQCRACGFPLPHSAPSEPICAACVARPPPFERARAALRYDEGSRGLILGFKHADRTEAAPTLGRWLVRAGQELLADADLLAPVPLHRRRLLRRGYNQAALLAVGVARATGVATVPDLVERVRPTPSQQGLTRAQRQTNVTPSAFRLHRRHAARVEGRRVVLVDDVYTTGATVGACAEVLRRGGAERVDVLTLARVVRSAADALF